MNELQRTLNESMESGSYQTNPVMNLIIDDDANYHAVLVIVGSCIVLAFAWLSIYFWIRFKQTSKTNELRWGFERKVYFSFGMLSSTVALFMMLIVAANVSNVLNPVHGFSLFVELFFSMKGVPI
ncbi:hypothetical protein ACFO9Q_18585 [Paenibacillus sp. GCM10023252]|uniref:hypothetical protein n=1 Tax=Paenibacillus sp. GCM10023252 TaxID=3252649 RepID=UPI00361BA683